MEQDELEEAAQEVNYSSVEELPGLLAEMFQHTILNMSDQEGALNQPVDISKQEQQYQLYHQHIPVEEAAEEIYHSSVVNLPELLAVRRCTPCEEEARHEDAVGHCKECGNLLCSECKKAHSRTSMTRHHTVREVRASVLRHHGKPAAMDGLIRKKGELSSDETRSVSQDMTRRPVPAIRPQPIVEDGDLATAILMSNISSWERVVEETHAECLNI